MPKVRVRVFANIRDVVGNREVQLEVGKGATIRELLYDMVKRYGDEFERLVIDSEAETLAPSIKVLLNGRNVELLKGLKTVVSDGDIVVIFPPVGGG